MLFILHFSQTSEKNIIHGLRFHLEKHKKSSTTFIYRIALPLHESGKREGGENRKVQRGVKK